MSRNLSSTFPITTSHVIDRASYVRVSCDLLKNRSFLRIYVVLNLLKILKLFVNEGHNNEQPGNNVINPIAHMPNRSNMMLLVLRVVVVNQQQSKIIDVGKIHTNLPVQTIVVETEQHKKLIEDYLIKI